MDRQLLGRFDDLDDKLEALMNRRPRPIRQVRYMWAPSPESLTMAVEPMLAEGWQPQGGPVVSYVDGLGRFVQMVVSSNEPPRPQPPAPEWRLRTLVRLSCGHQLEAGSDLTVDAVRGANESLAVGDHTWCPHDRAQQVVEAIWIVAEEEV